MPEEGSLRIGATVDKGGFEQGITSVEELTQKVAQRMAVSFEECSTRTQAAMRGISEDVKLAADTVSAESLKVAEATKLQAEAMADLRRAQVIAKDANVEEALSTQILAAAHVKAAAAAAGVATAKKEEAAAIVEANEAAALSENAFVAAVQRAGLAVRESLAMVREQMVETAETANLSAEGIGAGFSGLGALLGAGLAVGFAAHFLDELAKTNVELDHLHTKTGISVSSLAGLQLIVQSAGGDWEKFAGGLQFMVRSQALVEAGNKKVAQAWLDLGVTIDQVRNAKPEELLDLMAAGMARTEDASIRLNAAKVIGGKGGTELIPVLREEGAALEENTKKSAALTKITDESVEASRRWTEDTAKLAAQFKGLMIPVLEHAEDVVMDVVGTFDAAAAAILTVFEAVATAVVSLGKGLYGVGQLIFDVMTGNFKAIQSDAQSLVSSFTQTWKDGFTDIANYWKVVAKDFSKAPPRKRANDDGDDDDKDKGPLKGPKENHAAIHRDEAQLNELKIDHQVTLNEEIRFWEQKLTIARKGSQEYKDIQAKLAPLMQQKDKEKTSHLELAAYDVKAQITELEKAGEAQIRINEETAKKGIESFRLEREEEQRAAADKYKDLEQDSAFEVRMGRMTAEERIAILRNAASQEFQVRMQAAQAMALIDVNNGAKYQQDLNRQLQLTREHDRQIVQLNQQAAQQAQKGWQQGFERIADQFNQSVAQMLTTQQGFGASMARMVNGITENFVRNILKMTEQFLLGILLQKAGQKSQVVADAKVAAAHTYASVSAIPVVGPFLAPVAAAGAFAAVMAFESFNDGGVVTGGGGRHIPILAKAGERVLTPSQTQNFESMVNSSSVSKSSTVHLNYNPQVNAYDRSGMRSTLRQHAPDIIGIVREGLKNGVFA